MTYVLDASVLIPIQQAGQVAAVAKCGALPVVVTGIVWDELTLNARAEGWPKKIVDEVEHLLTTIAKSRTDIVPSDPAARSLTYITKKMRMDDGESEAIAYAYHHPDTTVVLEDVIPIREAIEHLRGRVLGLHGFLQVLVQQHGLAKTSAVAISNEFNRRKSSGGYQPPLWWPQDL